jgi:hypothetical protein
MSDRLLEEVLRCGYVACPAEPEVDRLSSLVHRSIEVGPVAAYLDIGLIDSPRAASGPTEAVPPLDELWGISPDPAQDGRMGQIQSALGHHFDQIPEAELVAQVPAYAQDDHLTIEVPPGKQLLKAAQLAHHPSSDSRKTHCTRWALLFAPEPHGVHIVKMRWGKIVEIDANEDSQAVAEALEMRAAHGLEEASAPPIVSQADQLQREATTPALMLRRNRLQLVPGIPLRSIYVPRSSVIGHHQYVQISLG